MLCQECHSVDIALRNSRLGMRSSTVAMPDLRDFFASDGPKDKAAPASEALVDSPEILELTQHCTWRDVALHPRTRNSLHHCRNATNGR